MPDTGSPWFLPYPDLSDEADAPRYFSQLAAAVAAHLSLPGDDSGWQAITVSPPFVGQTDNGPQVRRIGKAVWMKGGWTSAGITTATIYAVGVIPNPTFFIPATGANGRAGTSVGGAAAGLNINPNGQVQLRTNGVASSYFTTSMVTWLVD